MCFRKPLRSIMRLFVSSACAAGLTLLIATAASAYTLVFHDGRRLEIPATFVLTQATLTYEVAPAINRTVAVVLIDVAATERANNQAAGSFFARREQAAPVTETSSRAQHARTTLTNRELEPLRQQRIASEKRYEQRRIELGLPSVEESRRIQQRAENEMLEAVRERQQYESYWRERATALRDEIASVDAQINYLRTRLAESYPSQFATNGMSPWTLVPLGNRTAPNLRSTGAGVVGGVPTSTGFQNRGPFLPRAFRSPLAGPQFRTTPGDSFDFRFGRPRGLSGGFIPARPFEYFEDNYDAASLTESLNGLLTARAGLSARWQQLEDEARDARVPQVWLEP